MRRGRPNIRHKIQTLIIENFSAVHTPISINALSKLLSKQTEKQVSWNTVQKYLQELVEMGKIEAVSTPHSKVEGKDGLTVYILKKQ